MPKITDRERDKAKGSMEIDALNHNPLCLFKGRRLGTVQILSYAF